MNAVTNTNTSVAADEGRLKRSIQMKMFLSPALKKQLLGMDANQSIPLGQIVGEIFSVKEKPGTLPDGTPKMSLLALGDFEGMVYETGEVFTSAAAYLPGYYLEVVEAMLKSSGSQSIVFGIEVVGVNTGKSIPYAYEVTNLARRRPDNPINALKLEMAKAGRLRLPTPVVGSGALIEGEVREVPQLEAPKEDKEGETIDQLPDADHDDADSDHAPDMSDRNIADLSRSPIKKGARK